MFISTTLASHIGNKPLYWESKNHGKNNNGCQAKVTFTIHIFILLMENIHLMLTLTNVINQFLLVYSILA